MPALHIARLFQQSSSFRMVSPQTAITGIPFPSQETYDLILREMSVQIHEHSSSWGKLHSERLWSLNAIIWIPSKLLAWCKRGFSFQISAHLLWTASNALLDWPFSPGRGKPVFMKIPIGDLHLFYRLLYPWFDNCTIAIQWATW